MPQPAARGPSQRELVWRVPSWIRNVASIVVSSEGRAPDVQSGSRGFDSRTTPQAETLHWTGAKAPTNGPRKAGVRTIRRRHTACIALRSQQRRRQHRGSALQCAAARPFSRLATVKAARPPFRPATGDFAAQQIAAGQRGRAQATLRDFSMGSGERFAFRGLYFECGMGSAECGN